MKVVKIIWVKIIICCFIFPITGKAQVKEIKGKFYVNYGQTEITELDCYDFDNLIFTHEITSEMLTYDRIKYFFAFYSATTNKAIMKDDYVVSSAEVQVFQSNVSDKKEISVFIANSDDIESKKWLALSRSSKDLDSAYLVVSMTGSILSGYEDRWIESRRAYVKTPIYTEINVFNIKLKLQNRIKRKSHFVKYIPGVNIIAGFFFNYNDIQDLPETKNCFIYDGTKEYTKPLFTSFTVSNRRPYKL